MRNWTSDWSRVPSRFWRKVEFSGGCWEWKRSRKKGYGRFTLWINGEQKVVSAHRMAWRLIFGPIPKGMCVLHSCDNPPCVRPTHLFIGTEADNVHDMMAKGRKAKLVPGGNARITEDQVREIRARYAAGGCSLRALGREYSLKQAQIGRIVSRQQWKHVA